MVFKNRCKNAKKFFITTTTTAAFFFFFVTPFYPGSFAYTSIDINIVNTLLELL